MPVSLDVLRRRAASVTTVTGVAEFLDSVGFVQCDPIRSPARAQDLILRPRVAGYGEGDLDRAYASLPADEDVLYAYGYLSRPMRDLLHPRYYRHSADGIYTPDGLEAEVLAFVREHGVTHPRDAQAAFGQTSKVNGWGGSSSATTLALDQLHVRGLLRVARRERGIRLYEPVPVRDQPLDGLERLRRLTLCIAGILAPAPEATLRTAVAWVARGIFGPPGRRTIVAELVRSGDLVAAEVEGLRYVWPAAASDASGDAGSVDAGPVDAGPVGVRILAPFDPVVWDRRRFEHLWGWPYRFEAYVPAAKRQLGYYAMPLLVDDRVVGWANCARTAGGGLAVEIGYSGARPRRRGLKAELDAEIAALEAFLNR